MSLFGGLSLPFFPPPHLCVLPSVSFSLYKIPPILIIFRKNVEFLPKTRVSFFAHFPFPNGTLFLLPSFYASSLSSSVFIFVLVCFHISFLFFSHGREGSGGKDGQIRLDISVFCFCFVRSL